MEAGAQRGSRTLKPFQAHGSEPCVFTISPLALVCWIGLEPMRPRSGTAGLQPAAIAAMRPTLETRAGFEPAIEGLQPTALVHLAIASGKDGGSLTHAHSFGNWSAHTVLIPWMHRKGSNLRDLLQRQADYHYLTVHGCGRRGRTFVSLVQGQVSYH